MGDTNTAETQTAYGFLRTIPDCSIILYDEKNKLELRHIRCIFKSNSILLLYLSHLNLFLANYRIKYRRYE